MPSARRDRGTRWPALLTLLVWLPAAPPLRAQASAPEGPVAETTVGFILAGDAEDADSPLTPPTRLITSCPVVDRGLTLDVCEVPVLTEQAMCPPYGLRGWWLERQIELERDVAAACLDFQHMYTGRRLCCLAVVVGAAAPLANTNADESIRAWYQREVAGGRPYFLRQNGVNEFFNRAGEWQITVPIFLGAWAVGSVWDDRPACSAVGEWGERTLRALLVGAPASGGLQYGLGGGRPGEGSHWRPFQDSNTVAGHGFVGAVPFLTAAAMTRHRPLRFALFAASLGATWTRIDRDSHYFSQAMLGWTIAYLATQSVSMTELEMGRVQFAPVEMPQGGAGIGVVFRF